MKNEKFQQNYTRWQVYFVGECQSLEQRFEKRKLSILWFYRKNLGMKYSVLVASGFKLMFWVDSLFGIETSSIKKGWTWCWTCSRFKGCFTLRTIRNWPAQNNFVNRVTTKNTTEISNRFLNGDFRSKTPILGIDSSQYLNMRVGSMAPLTQKQLFLFIFVTKNSVPMPDENLLPKMIIFIPCELLDGALFVSSSHTWLHLDQRGRNKTSNLIGISLKIFLLKLFFVQDFWDFQDEKILDFDEHFKWNSNTWAFIVFRQIHIFVRNDGIFDFSQNFPKMVIFLKILPLW